MNGSLPRPCHVSAAASWTNPYPSTTTATGRASAEADWGPAVRRSGAWRDGGFASSTSSRVVVQPGVHRVHILQEQGQLPRIVGPVDQRMQFKGAPDRGGRGRGLDMVATRTRALQPDAAAARD